MNTRPFGAVRGSSSNGRASGLHPEGWEFESPLFHSPSRVKMPQGQPSGRWAGSWGDLEVWQKHRTVNPAGVAREHPRRSNPATSTVFS